MLPVRLYESQRAAEKKQQAAAHKSVKVAGLINELTVLRRLPPAGQLFNWL
jgi:hypothetical protein